MSAPTGRPLTELVRDYLDDPGPERLAALRSTIRSATGFDPDLTLAAEIGPLLQAGEHQQVVDLVTARMPGAALSPAAHRALAISLRELGHTEAAEREQAMAEISVSSVLATGDGTQERPWSVLRVADEYDVLGATGAGSTVQSSVSVEGRLLDRHEGDDGREVWFVVER